MCAAWSSGWRRRQAAKWETAVATRLPLGPDGVVRGAGPIAREAAGDRAALVLHGFGDTPESVATVAHALYAAGWTVHAPLLAGHGRDLPTFARSRAEDWLATARAAYATVRGRRARVAIVAQSMGAALAAVLLLKLVAVLAACALVAALTIYAVAFVRRLSIAGRTGPVPRMTRGGALRRVEPLKKTRVSILR